MSIILKVRYFIFLLSILSSGIIQSQILEFQDLVRDRYNLTNVELYHSDNYLFLKQRITKYNQESFEIDQRLFFKNVNRETQTYLKIITGLVSGDDHAEQPALSYLQSVADKNLLNKMLFYLSTFYFAKNQFALCLKFSTLIDNTSLTNAQILEIKFLQAYVYFETKNYQRAFVLFDVIRQVNTKNPYYYDAYYYYGYLNIELNNNLQGALMSFQKIEHNTYYRKIVPYYIANILYVLGYKQQTLVYIEKIFPTGKENTDLLYQVEIKKLLARLYFELVEYNKYIDIVNQFDSHDDLENVCLGVSYYKLNNIESTIRVMENFNPEDKKILFYKSFVLGEIYLKKQNKPIARNYFFYCRNNLILDTLKDYVVYVYAKLSLDIGYVNVAFNELQYFMKNYPHSPYYKEIQNLLLIVHTKTNNFKEAIRLIEALPDFNDRELLAKVYYGMALYLYNKGNTDSTKYYLDKVFTLPGHTELTYYLHSCLLKAELEYNAENYDHSLFYWQKGLVFVSKKSSITFNNTSNIKYNIAYCYFKKKDYSQALILFSKLYENLDINSLSPYSKDAYLRVADCNFMLKKYKSAVQVYNEYLKFFPQEGDYALYQLAIIEGISNPKNKILLLKSIINNYPKTVLLDKIYLEIGHAQMSANLFNDAVQTFQQMLSLNITSGNIPSILLDMATCQFNLNNTQQAIEGYLELIKKYPHVPETEIALNNLKEMFMERGDINTYVSLLDSMDRPLRTALKDSLLFATAEAKYRFESYEQAEKLFKNYLVTVPNGNDRGKAFFYLSNIYNINKNYTAMYPIIDSMIEQGQSNYLEKILSVINKIHVESPTDSIRMLKYNITLYNITSKVNNKISSLRNILIYYYTYQNWNLGLPYATDLLKITGIADYDKSLANSFVAQQYLEQNEFDKVLEINNAILKNNNADLGANAMYYNSVVYIKKNMLTMAEKNTFKLLNDFNSQQKWVLKSYLLLGDIYGLQKDYFNATATLQSLIANTKDEAIKAVAQEKLNAIAEQEKSALSDNNTQIK